MGFSQYLKAFMLKSLGLLIKNFKLPSDKYGISKLDFAKFLLLLLTINMPMLHSLDSVIKSDAVQKFSVIPIFFTIIQYISKIMIKKAALRLQLEQVKIYCVQGVKNLSEQNEFLEKTMQCLEEQLSGFMENTDSNNLKKNDCFVLIIRILENFLVNKKFEPVDYAELFLKNNIEVTEENQIVVVEEIKIN